MTTWPPLAAELPTDRRRLAIQLRRMLDRSTLTVPRLAARTALPESVWRAAFAATVVPPYAAVEVLAQASGADYARIRTLHRMAGKASGRPRPVPDPDPLDPLGPDDGVPRRRRALLPVILGALAAAALAAVIMTAAPSTGRAPAGDEGAPQSGLPSAAAVPGPGGGSAHTAAGDGAVPPGAGGPNAAAPAAISPPAAGDTPSAALGATVPVVTSTAAATTQPGRRPGRPSVVPGSSAVIPPVPPSEPSPSRAPAPPASSPAAPPVPPSSHSPAPAPTHTPVCIGLVILDICLG